MEEKERPRWGLRIIGSILLAAGGAVLLSVWFLGSRAMDARGISWLFPWMGAVLPGLGILLPAWAGLLWMPVTQRVKGNLAAVYALICVAGIAAFGWMSRVQVTVEKSPDGKHLLILEEQAGDGTVTVCRGVRGLWKRRKEQLPFTVDEGMKIQWLESDVCAVTYQSPDQEIHQYLATYGDRGDGISYLDPLVAVMGHWTVEGTNQAGWQLTVEGGTVTLANGGEQWEFTASDCVRFGTTAVALCEEGFPVWSLVLNEDCRINYNDLVARGGTLTLCPVSMDKTAALTFVCTDPKEEYSEQNPAMEQWEQDNASQEAAAVEQMRIYAGAETADRELENDAFGIFYVPSEDEEEAWNVRTALLTYEEPYRRNGVDCRVQIDSVERLAGDAGDGLYEVIFTELCISPGNQGSSPEGETVQLTWRIRMMKAAEGYYAYVLNWRDEGTVGLSAGEKEKWELSDQGEYHYFLAGKYDTTYMYVSRRTPREGMEALYGTALAADYPRAAAAEYDGMPCMDLTGEEKVWLLYDGITEDYENYSYRVISLKEAGLAPDSRFEVLETYRIPMREE